MAPYEVNFFVLEKGNERYQKITSFTLIRKLLFLAKNINANFFVEIMRVFKRFFLL